MCERCWNCRKRIGKRGYTYIASKVGGVLCGNCYRMYMMGMENAIESSVANKTVDKQVKGLFEYISLVEEKLNIILKDAVKSDPSVTEELDALRKVNDCISKDRFRRWKEDL